MFYKHSLLTINYKKLFAIIFSVDKIIPVKQLRISLFALFLTKYKTLNKSFGSYLFFFFTSSIYLPLYGQTFLVNS